MTDNKEPKGLEELIGRLREQGVEVGKHQGEELLQQARRRAEEHLEQARREAEEIINKAHEEAEQTKSAGDEAVQLAVRDAILRLKTELVEQFSDRVRRLVTRELEDQGLLRSMILEVAGQAAPPTEKSVQILLPKDVVGLEELRQNPEKVKEGTLSHFVVTITQELLREGIEIGTREDEATGIHIVLKEEQLEIDLTDRSVAELLLRHLVPRFRAMMEGIIQ